VKGILTTVTNGAESPDQQHTPWRPPSLGELPVDEELARHLYVVVEEEIDDVVGLLVSPWPCARDDGRLKFHSDAPEVEVAVDRHELQERLASREVPEPTVDAAGGPQAIEELRSRPAEVGDVYAVFSGPQPPTPEELEDLSGKRGAIEWMATVIDITADAREAAKIATYEALTPPLAEDVADALRRKAHGEPGPA
jgi:hypothetical protein